MTTRIAAGMFFFGLLLVLGAVGGMDDPAKMDYFLEQCLVALVGLGLMYSGTRALDVSQYYDQR
jgi:hypothetical protein